MGPHWAPGGHRGTQGEPPELPGALQRLQDNFLYFPDFGLPAAPGLAAPSPCCPASGLPRRDVFFLEKHDPRQKKEAQPLLFAGGVPRRDVFFPTKNDVFLFEIFDMYP